MNNDDYMKCKYTIPWWGRCKENTTKGAYCDTHSGIKCFETNCNKPAVRGCAHTSQFVCGVPECGEHRHHYSK